jgi:putative PIN family toxin of toxin-antitoxin system
LRVFLDTNVLVSAFASRGICADLFRYVLVEHELLVGEVVLVELERVLLGRFKVPPHVVVDIERLLRDQHMVQKPPRHLSLGLRDVDDEWIVASAVAGEAKALVTGDADILDEKNRISVPVYSPREFWQHVRG